MDTLPELRSDADVDSLMARLQAKLGPSAATRESTPAAPSADVTLRDLFSLQQELVSVVTRAIQLVVDVLDDVDADRDKRPSPAANHERVKTSAATTGRVTAPAKNRSRSPRPARRRRPRAAAKRAGRKTR